MLKLDVRQLLSILLVLLMVYPSPLPAASGPSVSSRAVLGSITSYGKVQVGEVQMPTEGTLFSGDRVQTQTGNAVIHYREGARVVLGNQSEANFSSSQIQLQKGLMSFQSGSGDKLVFAASTLRLQPATPKSAANITLENKKASVAVTEGTVKVVDPSGAQLASLKAGEARLFEEASAASPPSPAPAPAPAAAPQGAASSRAWLIALGVGIVGTSLGIAGLVRANDADDRADEAQATATAAQTLAAQLQASNAALQTQANTLRSQLVTLSQQAAALSQFLQGQDTLLRQLTAALADVERLQAQLAALQVQINQAAGSGNLALVTSLANQQADVNRQLQAATTNAINLSNQLNATPRPPGVSPIT